MRSSNKVVIVGGGSTWTPGILSCIAKKKDSFPISRLTLYDTDKQRQAVVGKFGEIFLRENYEGLSFDYTTDKENAYTDVNFVFCQMRTGGYPMRERDEKIPLKYD